MATSPSLVLNSNSSANGYLSVDLSQYLDLTQGAGMDPQNPAFREALISHSLLKEGGVLALEDLKAKELIFPLLLNSTTASGLATLIEQINQVVTSAGATYVWQDANLSQATTFDAISGQLDLEYDYRRSERFWMKAKLRLFTAPFGRTAGPRAYVSASGVGPVLMVSPYTSGGALAIGASTQAGVAGYGGKPAGASSGVFYWGSPSLAGDAPAMLVMSYMTSPNGCTASATAVSVLPDATYQPIPALGLGGVTTRSYTASVLGGTVYQFPNPGSTQGTLGFQPLLLSPKSVAWSGSHRLFALARASGTPGQLSTISNDLVQTSTVASVAVGTDWGLYDLGTFQIRPSEANIAAVNVQAAVPSVAGVASNACLDVNALIMLPDYRTWYCGGPSGISRIANTVLIDDTLADQGAFNPAFASFAASPANATWSQRVTQYSRGQVPRPDPRDGLPIIAILGIGASSVHYPGAALSAQVSVLERARYVLP